jgi:hypothetical protein
MSFTGVCIMILFKADEPCHCHDASACIPSVYETASNLTCKPGIMLPDLCKYEIKKMQANQQQKLLHPSRGVCDPLLQQNWLA